MKKLSERLGTLRQERQRPKMKRCPPKPITGTVTLRKTVRGQLVFNFPSLIRKNCSLKIGGRVWFFVNGRTLVISGKPWGPYPESGRRMNNRLTGARHKPQRKDPPRKSRRNGIRRAEVET